MTTNAVLARGARWLTAGALLLSAAVPAHAKIDKFDARHKSGACSDAQFNTGFFLWDGRPRINIATGERISVRLYGDMAEKAEDASGADIFEWIETSGYGWVDIHIRAAAEHGTGNRTVTVKWPGWMGGGTETIPLKIVASCDSVFGSALRVSSPDSPNAGAGRIGMLRPPPMSVQPQSANLLPAVQTPYVLARPLGALIPTPAGGMAPVDGAFCAGLPPNVVRQVPVPVLKWGVSGVNITQAAAGFSAQLFNETDPDNPVQIGNLPLPNGFPANTPVVQTNNYNGRPTAIRVIANPQFVTPHQSKTGQDLSTTQTFPGCFTAPGVAQPLDPARFRVVVDPQDTVNEGGFENDNELMF